MQRFENTPEVLAMKEILREFFLGIIDNVKGAFAGLLEWISTVRLNMPPMLKIFGNTKFNGIVLIAVIAYIVFINIKAYFLFAADKRYAAEEGAERVPEWRLLANIWLGGAIGSAVAMYKLRHKTKHKVFTISAKVCVFVDLLVFSFVIGFLGFWTFF